MLTPDQLQALQAIGVLGVVTIGLLALFTRKVRPGKDVDEALAAGEARVVEIRAMYTARLHEVTEDRNAWRKIAEGAVDRLDIIADLLRAAP